MERVLGARFLCLHGHFSRLANLDLGDAAGHLCQTLFELLPVVIAGRGFDLVSYLLDAAADVLGGAGSFDDGGVFLVHPDLLHAAQVAEGQAFELDAEVLEDRTTSGQDGDILEHGLAAVAKGRGLHSAAYKRAAEFVGHQHGKHLPLDLLRYDEERLAGARDLLEERDQVLNRGYFLLMDQDVRILEDALPGGWVGYEVRGLISLVELKAIDELDFGLERFSFLDSDDAVLADLLHCLGYHVTDFRVVVGGDLADVGDFVAAPDLDRKAGVLAHDRLKGAFDAALQFQGIGAGSDVLEPLIEDCLCENSGGRGAVTGHIAGL